MNCTNCDKELKKEVKNNIEIRECSSCGLIWLDAEEFRKMKDAVDEDLNWMDFDIWKHESEFRVMKKPRKCPKCLIDTITIQYGNTNIEVDYCPKCKAIMLEKGEFKKIIESLEKELINKSPSEYWQTSIEEAKELFTGHESFASEWKDFTTVVRLMQDRILTDNPKLEKLIVELQVLNPFR